jgi:hypothetical protein
MTHWLYHEYDWLRARHGTAAREKDRRAGISPPIVRVDPLPLYSDLYDADRLIVEMVRQRDEQTS